MFLSLVIEKPLTGPSLLEITMSGKESPLKSVMHADLASSGTMIPLSWGHTVSKEASPLPLSSKLMLPDILPVST